MPLRHAAMLEVNEFLVLDYLRDHGAASRPELGRALGLSAATVSRIVGRLLRNGLVVDEGRKASDGGRPPGVVSFNGRAGAIMAIDLGASSCHGALADLAGATLHEQERPTDESSAFATLASMIRLLRAEAGRARLPVAALAVGVPAIVDPDTGVGRAGPSVCWEAFDVAAALAEQVSIPFVVENDVNLSALAHAWRGDGRQVDDFFTLHLGAGVGGAVVANGALVKGRHNGAGEVGYMLADRGQARQPLDGPLGGMEQVIRAASLVARARRRGAALADTADDTADDTAAALALTRAARDGDACAAEIIDELLDLVGMVLVAVGSIVDPALMILDGPVGRSLEPWLPRLSGVLDRRLPHAPRVVVSSLGGGSTLIGAVAAALQLERRHAAPPALFGVFSSDEGVRMG